MWKVTGGPLPKKVGESKEDQSSDDKDEFHEVLLGKRLKCETKKLEQEV